jgi:hypothetical protein
VIRPAGLFHNTVTVLANIGSGGTCHRIANLRCGRHGTCPPADQRFVRPDTVLHKQTGGADRQPAYQKQRRLKTPSHPANRRIRASIRCVAIGRMQA